MRLIDLHVHTTASDGLYSPFRVVQEAHKKNLAAVAITDHDTMKGLEEAEKAAARFAVEIVPGIEFSTLYQKKEIHILGYYCNPENLLLQETLLQYQKDRRLRMEKMIDRLKEMGINVELDDVLVKVKGGIVGRPHLAAVLCQKGFCSTFEEAFSRYIGYDRPAYVGRMPFPPEKAISVIREAEGVPVLAHPGLSEEDALIPSLVRAGLQGIEVYHPEHDEASINRYLHFARAHHLLITGGSDFHGENIGSARAVGAVTLDYLYLEALQKLLKGQGRGVKDFNYVKKGF